MNWLAHLWLADRSGTSAAGQLLGDSVKGDYSARFNTSLRDGIRLHRQIDGLADATPEYAAARRFFAPPLRRYANILSDIAFDHSLARLWPAGGESLPAFADRVERQIIAEWPTPQAPALARHISTLLQSYRHENGVQKALEHIGQRLTRANPVAAALPAIRARRACFDRDLSPVLARVERRIRADIVVNAK